jgi:hypothetical protein
MEIFIMKKFQLITIVAALLLCNACIKDLDTVPLYENDFTADAAYNTSESYKQGLAKIYGGFVLVGQDGTSGSPEIAINDGGASELNRAWWSIQELSTDAAKVAWVNDAWTREVNTNTWTTLKNDAIYAVFARTTLVVSLVNEYLRQTSDELLAERGVDASLQAEIHRYRAEARLIRAYVYWMGMDVFGNMPFFTESDPVGTFLPPEKKRADLFAWIEAELTALTNDPDLADARANTYPRVDKGVAWGLLARMYLNAEVYTGTARWNDAKTAAANVIAGGYGLATEYAHLFMADNGENPDTRRELIYAVAYDKEKTRSYGGTTFLTAAVLSAEEIDQSARNAIGTNDGWGGPRTTFEYAQKFGVSNPDTSLATFDCNDKRAMFHIKGREEEITNMSVFKQGWSVVKYSNLKSTETPPVENSTFSSTDYPLMRLAEIYLIYAEATLRAAGGSSSNDATALGYLNDLRTRAFKSPETPLTAYDLQYLIDERARELMWEGHRRTDLIRFGLYTTGDYLWPWKGGNPIGQALDERFNLCPYPVDDVRLNENLTPTDGYAY